MSNIVQYHIKSQINQILCQMPYSIMLKGKPNQKSNKLHVK